MARVNKNWDLMDQVADVLEKRRRNVAQQITQLTLKDQLRRSVYVAVTEHAIAEGWCPDRCKVAHAVLKEMFDGNRKTLELVIQGVKKQFTKIVADTTEIFVQVVADRDDVDLWINLPGISRHLEETYT